MYCLSVYAQSACASSCCASCWTIHSIFFTPCCCMCRVCVPQPPSSNQHVTSNSAVTCITLLASYVHSYLQIRIPCALALVPSPPCAAMCRIPLQLSLWFFSCSSFHLSLAVRANPAADRQSASQVVMRCALQ